MMAKLEIQTHHQSLSIIELSFNVAGENDPPLTTLFCLLIANEAIKPIR